MLSETKKNAHFFSIVQVTVIEQVHSELVLLCKTRQIHFELVPFFIHAIYINKYSISANELVPKSFMNKLKNLP